MRSNTKVLVLSIYAACFCPAYHFQAFRTQDFKSQKSNAFYIWAVRISIFHIIYHKGTNYMKSVTVLFSWRCILGRSSSAWFRSTIHTDDSGLVNLLKILKTYVAVCGGRRHDLRRRCFCFVMCFLLGTSLRSTSVVCVTELYSVLRKWTQGVL